MIEAIALVVIVLAALYLLALGTASLVMPTRAGRLLLGFASSRQAHFVELFLRFVIGAALILYAPRMLLSGAFSIFGWILLVTTACLLVVPWQWHRRFAQYAVPRVTRYIAWVGLVSLAMSGLIFGAVACGGGA